MIQILLGISNLLLVNDSKLTASGILHFFHFSKLPYLPASLRVLFGHALEGSKGFTFRSLDWRL